MKPVEFPQQTMVLAKDQPQYEPFPVHVDQNTGACIGCFELTDEERSAIADGGKLWLWQYTFGRSFQPVALTTDSPWPEAVKVEEAAPKTHTDATRWTDAQCLAFAGVAFRHAPKNLPVGVTLDDIRMGAAIAAQQPQPSTAVAWTAEDACEQFIAAEVDNAPEALRRLGDWLCNVLDEDEQKTASRMVIGAMMETSDAIRKVADSKARTHPALWGAAKAFYNLTVADPEVIIRAPSAAKRDAIIAARDTLRVVLTEPVTAQSFDEWWKSFPAISSEHPETMDDRSLAKVAWDAAMLAAPSQEKLR